MLFKRILGAVVVRQGLAVQSFGYKRWLPLGKPEFLVENLNHWGADGIVVLAIDRKNNGPDLELIKRLGSLGLSTPLIYGGGILTRNHAIEAIRAGAERLILDTALSRSQGEIRAMGKTVGVQALIASIPLIQNNKGAVQHISHRTGTLAKLSDSIKTLIATEKVSEVLTIDVAVEGSKLGFNTVLLDEIKSHTKLPILAFGGLANSELIRPLLNKPQVAGIVVGNALNYREHAIGQLKSELVDQPLRPHLPQSYL